MADDFDHVAKVLDGMADEVGYVTEAELAETGHLALSTILLRTKNGIDVDHHGFAQYSADYVKVRGARGLSSRPDLAVTGHMLGSLTVQAGREEVSIVQTNPLEAKKLATHNYGVSATVSIGGHSRGTYVDKKGRRASREEIKRDKRRKTKQLSQRKENVSAHQRRMNVPKREILDVRHPSEIEALTELLGDRVMARMDKTIR